MSLRKLPALACTIVLLFVLPVACSKENSTSPYKGNWAYSHEPKEPAMTIKNGGKAKLDGKNFTYTEKEGILRLENKAGDLAYAKFKTDDKKHIFLLTFALVIMVSSCDKTQSSEGLTGKALEYHEKAVAGDAEAQ